MEIAAALRVSPRPGSRYVVQAALVVKGSQRLHSSWFLSSIFCHTHHRRRARRMVKTTDRRMLRRLARGPGVS